MQAGYQLPKLLLALQITKRLDINFQNYFLHYKLLFAEIEWFHKFVMSISTLNIPTKFS